MLVNPMLNERKLPDILSHVRSDSTVWSQMWYGRPGWQFQCLDKGRGLCTLCHNAGW